MSLRSNDMPGEPKALPHFQVLLASNGGRHTLLSHHIASCFKERNNGLEWPLASNLLAMASKILAMASNLRV